MKRKLIIGGSLAALIGVAAAGCGVREDDDAEAMGATMSGEMVAEGEMVEVPMFEVDPYWPKPLPNHWIIGSAIGVDVDSRDHVFIVHRPGSLNPGNEADAALDPPGGVCCAPAPDVLEFDPQGNLVGHFGGPGEGYTWPVSNHGLGVDSEDNIWIGSNGGGDSHILKFTREGEFLMQLGEAGKGVDSNDTTHFSMPASISFNASGEEAFIGDGYGNKRVVVIDPHTGRFLRYWGAYGNRPDDADLGPYDPEAPLPQQFRGPVHCAEPSDDGLLYVCDRLNNRIQVFRTDGTFVTEKQVAPRSLGFGAAFDIAFSHDPEQRFIYLADGVNERVYILDRESLDVLTHFGDGGRQPGQFRVVHSIATDSQGNIYTTETLEGKRVQKFLFRGMGQVAKGTDQGVLWPITATR